MKKLISATLAASLALSLAACGSSASTDSVAASSEAASTESTAASSEAAQTYANVLVVKEGRENDPAIQALYAALTSDKVKDYINSTYDGAVVPIF